MSDANALRPGGIEHKLGIHASPTAVMSFGDKDGAIGYLVGELNRGLPYMFTMMNHARLNVGLEGVAISERAYQQALGYARERVQGRVVGAPAGSPIAYHPDVKRMLLDMKSRIEAMRALAYYTAGRMDVAHLSADAAEAKAAQQIVDLLIPIVKGWCTENAIGITSTGVQVHGGMGFIEETGAAQHFRDARITTIYEGTTGIHANDLVGRKTARDGGVAAKQLIAEIQADLKAWGAGDVAELARALEAPLARVSETVDWILATDAVDPARVLSAAVPILHLFGLTFGGWLIVKQAASAARDLANGGDAQFLNGKIAYAKHYVQQVLPHAQAYYAAAIGGSEETAKFDVASL